MAAVAGKPARRLAAPGGLAMKELLLDNNAGWFTIPAIAGTVIFLIRIGLMMLGGVGDVGEFDTDIPDGADGLEAGLDAGGGGGGGAGGGLDYGDTDYAFQILSVQAAAAFAAGFGWGGIAALKSFGLDFGPSLLIGAATGVGVVWLFGLGMKSMFRLQSSGTTNIRMTVGREGEVYLGVPAKGAGRGRVRVIVDDRDRIYNAVTEGEEIPRRSRVRVIKVNDDNTLLVTLV